jgi:hypothetical protein
MRVYQKLINKYEQSPTPYQPKKSTSKFDEETSNNIKKVNRERKDIKRERKMSVYMYELE